MGEQDCGTRLRESQAFGIRFMGKTGGMDSRVFWAVFLRARFLVLVTRELELIKPSVKRPHKDHAIQFLNFLHESLQLTPKVYVLIIKCERTGLSHNNNAGFDCHARCIFGTWGMTHEGGGGMKKASASDLQHMLF